MQPDDEEHPLVAPSTVETPIQGFWPDSDAPHQHRSHPPVVLDDPHQIVEGISWACIWAEIV